MPIETEIVLDTPEFQRVKETFRAADGTVEAVGYRDEPKVGTDAYRLRELLQKIPVARQANLAYLAAPKASTQAQRVIDLEQQVERLTRELNLVLALVSERFDTSGT